MGYIDEVYDKIPKPELCCENCANGTMHTTSFGDEWPDVYRCRLDNILKDYRIHCASYADRASGERSGGAGSPQQPRAPRGNT